MGGSKVIKSLSAMFVAVLAVLCFGPWYDSYAVSTALGVIKVAGLLAIFLASLAVIRASDSSDPNRRNWLILGLSFLSSTIGQSFLFYYQMVGAGTPFPSLADPFFVLYAPLVIFALFSFCRQAFGAGLSLGSPLVFWSPALAILVLSAIGLPLILSPVIKTGGSWQEIFLNVYYPVISFAALAPCAVILRFAFKFRGGHLFWVWFILTAGFLGILLADLSFAYFSLLEMTAMAGLVDFLYASGYILIALAVAYQRVVLD